MNYNKAYLGRKRNKRTSYVSVVGMVLMPVSTTMVALNV